jgi:methylenetetrahydrofolate dehydrogenase (NADP+)/methenyltetrahydrofolate cyclohydrolase
MATILDGKIVRDSICTALSAKRAAFPHSPTLAILQVGDRPDSASYIQQKKKFAEKVGAIVVHMQYPEDVKEEKLVEQIGIFNADLGIHGIIVQLPLPPHLSAHTIIEAIDPEKDVDGLTAMNAGRFLLGFSSFAPATAKGVRSLLDFYKIPVASKNVVVVGKSNLVGKPLALLMMNAGATVTVCHKQTVDLGAHTRKADIIIVAAGSPNLITADHVSKGQVIIDIGINKNPDPAGSSSKLSGDVVFAEVEPIVSAISPVPGGVGPLTVASLFQNLFDACEILKKEYHQIY